MSIRQNRGTAGIRYRANALAADKTLDLQRAVGDLVTRWVGIVGEHNGGTVDQHRNISHRGVEVDFVIVACGIQNCIHTPV